MPEEIHFRTIVKLAVLAIGLIFIIVYISFQARFLISGPQIVLTDRADHLQNERQVYLSGEAFNISHLWLNNRQIYTDAQGKFKEPLILENGYTVAVLKAEDRYGRETKVSQSFVYAPVSFLK
jgi:hypothetical protein